MKNLKIKPMSVEIILTVIIIGLSAGMLSGLVGIGGGLVLVPAMVFFLGYNQTQAQGTSLGVLAFPVVLVGFLTYYKEMNKQGTPIDFKVIGLLALGFVIGAYFGSMLAIKIDKEILKKIFAAILFYTAIRLIW